MVIKQIQDGLNSPIQREKGLKFTGNPLIGFNASHFTREEIENSRYSFQMIPHSKVYLNIDKGQLVWVVMTAGV